MADRGTLSFDEQGYVDMDSVPEAELDPAEIADLQTQLSTVPAGVVDSQTWDDLLTEATSDDAAAVDESLLPGEDDAAWADWPSADENAAEGWDDLEARADDPTTDDPPDHDGQSEEGDGLDPWDAETELEDESRAHTDDEPDLDDDQLDPGDFD